MLKCLPLETCQSGLTYLFAKEAGVSKPLASSNLAVSAAFLKQKENWMSGLNQRFTKPPNLYRFREFESHILRKN